MMRSEQRIALHIIGRRISWAAAQEVADRACDIRRPITRAGCNMALRWRGRLKRRRRQGYRNARGAELRIRARGLRATAIEARNGVFRRASHVMEAQLKRRHIPLVFARRLREGPCLCCALALYNGASPCSALHCTQSA
eukprot:2677877-Pyramimonas_sp.AAC.1